MKKLNRDLAANIFAFKTTVTIGILQLCWNIDENLYFRLCMVHQISMQNLKKLNIDLS